MIRGVIRIANRRPLLPTDGDRGSFDESSQSWIEYFDHPGVFRNERRTRNYVHVDVGTYEADVGVDGECLSIDVDVADRAVSFRAGVVQTIPLYVAASASIIRFSWQLSDLVMAGCAKQLDVDLARDYVLGRERYSYRTMFGQIVRVTERACVEVRDGKTSVVLPQPARSLHPKPIRPGSDVVGAYVDLMSSTIKDRCLAPVICELSGGFDSSNVCLTASAVYKPGLESYGLIFPDSPGRAHQIERRDAVVSAGHLADTALDIKDRPLFGHWFDDSVWLNPYDELYERVVVDAVTSTGVVGCGYTVATGIGGDECMLPSVAPPSTLPVTPHGSLMNLYQPKSVIPETALMACNARAPMFLRLGLLPFNPYCEPQVVAFSERLPNEWKIGRLLQRAAMARFGVSEQAMLRPHPENFETALRAGLAKVDSQMRSHLTGVCVAKQVVTPVIWQKLFDHDFAERPINMLSMTVRLAILEQSIRSQK